MKARLARKLFRRQFYRIPPYWWQRILDTLDGGRKDHRVVMAIKITKRKKTRRARLSPSGDSGKE